jgi:RNase P subunit RPR2
MVAGSRNYKMKMKIVENNQEHGKCPKCNKVTGREMKYNTGYKGMDKFYILCLSCGYETKEYYFKPEDAWAEWDSGKISEKNSIF